MGQEREGVCAGASGFFPDLILSDYDLPQYTGALALIEAKRLHPEVPFIIVTGAFDEDGDDVERDSSPWGPTIAFSRAASTGLRRR